MIASAVGARAAAYVPSGGGVHADVTASTDPRRIVVVLTYSGVPAGPLGGGEIYVHAASATGARVGASLATIAQDSQGTRYGGAGTSYFGFDAHPYGVVLRLRSKLNNVFYQDVDVHVAQSGLQAQAVTISPTSAEISPGGSGQFTASGGNTTYEWRVTGDTGLVVDGGTATFTPPGDGTYTVEVRATENATYAASPWVQAVVTVGYRKTVTIPFPANDTEWVITWYVYQIPTPAGDMDTIVSNPGDGPLIKSYSDFPHGDDVAVNVSYSIDHIEWHGISEVWKYVPGGRYNSNSTNVTPSSQGVSQPSQPLQPPPVVAPSGSLPTGEPSGTPSKGPSSSGTTWVTGGNAGGSGDYTGPTDSTFREGITKLEKQLIDANKHLEKMVGREGEEMPDGSSIGPDADALGASGNGLIPGAMSAGGGAPATIQPTASTIWQVSLPLPGGSVLNLNFDPVAHPFFSALARFVRSLIVWCTTLALVIGLVVNTDKALAAICSVPSTTAGTTSVLGTGTSIAPALIKAGVIVAAIALAIPALYAVFLSDVGGVSLLGTLLSNPVNSAANAAAASGHWVTAITEGIRLANFFVPIDYILVCLATWWFHKVTAVTTIVIVSVKIRATAA